MFTLDKTPQVSKQGKGKHDWTAILDGRPHVLVRDKDYKAKYFDAQVRLHCRTHGINAVVRKGKAADFLSKEQLQASKIDGQHEVVYVKAERRGMPETKAPETKAPETKAPETKAPETKAPETPENK